MAVFVTAKSSNERIPLNPKHLQLKTQEAHKELVLVSTLISDLLRIIRLSNSLKP